MGEGGKTGSRRPLWSAGQGRGKWGSRLMLLRAAADHGEKRHSGDHGGRDEGYEAAPQSPDASLTFHAAYIPQCGSSITKQRLVVLRYPAGTGIPGPLPLSRGLALK